jgi:hypothetical protein
MLSFPTGWAMAREAVGRLHKASRRRTKKTIADAFPYATSLNTGSLVQTGDHRVVDGYVPTT